MPEEDGDTTETEEQEEQKQTQTDKPTVVKEDAQKQSASDEHGDNVVLVGNKKPMPYVFACVTLFNEGTEDVRLKARGRAITRAVDVAEMVRRGFVEEAEVGQIDIGTDEVENRDGEETKVSTIDIQLTK